MRIEIDQSGKVEETNKDTVLALSNHIECSILISSSVKKQLLEILRKKKNSDKIIYLQIFSAGLFLLLRPYLEELTEVIIDTEYQGKEADIKAILKRLFQKQNLKFNFQLYFKQIGKNSSAHLAAYGVGRSRKPNKIIKLKEFLSLF